MFTKFTIKNFRCFDNLTLENISRLNLIGGMNSVGKTSLLEAIFLFLGANVPDLALRINTSRDIQKFFTNNSDSMWGWLFADHSLDKIIEFEAVDENKITETVEIKLVNSEKVKLSLPEKIQSQTLTSSVTTELIADQLKFTYKIDDKQFSSSLIITPNGLERTTDEEKISLKPAVFMVTNMPSFKDDVKRFSDLEKVNDQGEIIKTLQLLEPRLKRLAVLIEGELPVIAGDIGISQLIPISYLGQGISRLLSIILVIATTKNGIVLIDEIENGLHHSKMVEIWKAIDLISSKTNTQVFATTHSMECIESAHQAFSESNGYNFSYYRLERKKEDNTIKVLSYNQNTINTSIDLNWEMR